jgi:hypothetical protein
MQVYNQYEDTFSYWPGAIETSWQSAGLCPRTALAGDLAPKIPHLGLSDILLIASLVYMPSRPHGLITWIANYYQISRVSVYALAARVKGRLLSQPQPYALLAAPEPTIAAESVTQARLNRTILATLLPGKAAIRPTQVILQEAFSTTRSVGYISDLRLAAGRRAGEKLAAVDYRGLGPVLVLRDETYFGGKPILLLVEPVTTTIVGIHACEDRQAETWATALLLAQEQGVEIAGVIEDMAKMYPKSLEMAGLKEIPQQKDIWHLLREGQRRRRIVERAAYRLMGQVDKLEQQLRDQWDETLFLEKYIPAVAKEETIMDHIRDRNGDPILTNGGGSFVKVERPGLTAGRTQAYRGVVQAVTRDGQGALIKVAEWRAGRLTGRTRLARPEHCQTVKAPAAPREHQAQVARITIRQQEKTR